MGTQIPIFMIKFLYRLREMSAFFWRKKGAYQKLVNAFSLNEISISWNYCFKRFLPNIPRPNKPVPRRIRDAGSGIRNKSLGSSLKWVGKFRHSHSLLKIYGTSLVGMTNAPHLRWGQFHPRTLTPVCLYDPKSSLLPFADPITSIDPLKPFPPVRILNTFLPFFTHSTTRRPNLYLYFTYSYKLNSKKKYLLRYSDPLIHKFSQTFLLN